MTLNSTHCCLLVAGLGIVAASAAAAPPTTEPDTESSRRTTLHEQVNDRLGVSASRLVPVSVPQTPDVPISATFTIDGAEHTLDLEPHRVRSANYQLLVQAEDGTLVPTDPGPERALRGTVRGVPGSRVAGSLMSNGLQVVVDLGDGGPRHWLEPATEAAAGMYALYNDADMLTGGDCGLDTSIVDAIEPAGGPGGVAGAGECIFTAQLACDSDHEYYLDHNSSPQEVQDEITAIINTQNLQYESQTNITHEIVVIVVRPFDADPYTTSNPSSLLAQFRVEWEGNQPGITRDVGQLFTGRDLDGTVIGIASVLGGICTSQAYCLSQDIGGFACRTDLSAHELGHLWGGFHCSCSDPNFTMNPVLTCANVFSQGSINSITNHRDSRTCLFNPCEAQNDQCESFQFIGDGVQEFTTTGTSTDGPGGLICGVLDLNKDVWYFYTAPCDGQATFDLCGSTFDTAMAVYPQFVCPSSASQAIACSDNEVCGNQASITLDVEEGETYVLQLGSATNDEGAGILTIVGPDCDIFPSNDDCGDAEFLPVGETPFSTDFATTDGPADLCGAGTIDNDIWYRFQSPCDDTITMSLCGSDFDTRLAVYDVSCPGAPGSVIACSDDSPCGGSSELTFEATAGAQYRVRIGGADGATGAGMINVNCAAADSCPWDNNDDGQINVDDLVNLVVAWGPCSGCAEDVNESGAVDVDDLVELIINWGPCP